jgi:hypothetical protein
MPGRRSDTHTVRGRHRNCKQKPTNFHRLTINKTLSDCVKNGFTFQNGRRAVCGGGERCRRCRQFVGVDRLRRNDGRFGRIRFLVALDGLDLLDRIDAVLLVVRCFVDGSLPHLQFLFQFCQKEKVVNFVTRVFGDNFNEKKILKNL